jgi:hypothetical protein
MLETDGMLETETHALDQRVIRSALDPTVMATSATEDPELLTTK